MKKIYTIIISVLFFFSNAYSQSWSWLSSTGNTGNDLVKNISFDSSGNSYVTGIFKQTMFAGPNQISSFGGDDFFIASYDEQGSLRWARSGGGTADDGFTIISATDPFGNTTVALGGSGSVHFGAFHLTNILNDITLLRYDSSGNIIFATSYGSISNDVPMGLASDTLGNFYVTGFFNNNAQFGTTTLSSYGLTDFFLAKFDDTGNPLWAKRGGGSSYDAGTGVAIDRYNHVCVTGYFNDLANFDGQFVTSEGGDDILIASYDPDGNLNWINTGKGSGTYDIGNKIDVDRYGNIYVAGQFEDTITFGSFTKSSIGSIDAFIAACDSAGNFKWVSSYGGGGEDVAFEIDVLENGNMFFSGYFSQTASFGTNTLISNGAKDMFTACNLSSGLLYWVKQNGGTGDDIARSIRARSESECFVGGSYSDYVSFDNFNFNSLGGLDFFAGKMSTPVSGVPLISEQATFSVFPNPVMTGDLVTIDVSAIAKGEFSICIFDNSGSLVIDNTIRSNHATHTFMFPSVNAGLYHIRLIDSNGKMSVARIIIQN